MDELKATDAENVRRSGVPILALLTANVISQAGNQVTALAIPWYVLQLTHSPGKVGLTGFVQGTAYIISAFLGGAAIDRLGLRRASVLTDLLSALAIGAIPLLHHAGGLALGPFLTLVFAASLLSAPGLASRRGMLASLAELAGLRLERATSSDQGISNLANLIGPLLGGVLLAVLGPTNVLLVDAASFAVSALLIGLLVPALWVAESQSGYWHDLWFGLGFVWRDRVVASMALVGSFTNAVGTALFGVVLPVYAARVIGGATGLGAMAAADGGGALAGTVIFGSIGHRLPRRPTLIVSFGLSALGLGLLAFKPPFIATLAVLAVDGLMFGFIGPLTYTVYQERIPSDLRGRVFATIIGVHRLALPFGALLAGLLLGGLGITPALIVIAAASLVMPLSIALNPWLRSL